MTPDEFDDILRGAEIRPAPDDSRPSRKPRNQGVPELDPDVWKSFQTGQEYDISPVDVDYAHPLKLALQKSARYLTRIHETEVRVTVHTIRLDAEHVVVRFIAHPPKMLGAAIARDRRRPS